MHGASFSHSLISYGFLGALAIALVAAAMGDLRHRLISNRLTGSMALTAPLFWWASGLSLPAISWQVALALGCLCVCAALFAAGAMGGGDVKLLTALALWLPPARFAQLLVVMALTGGVLALLCVMGPTMKRRSRQQPASAVPYGVAIAGGALWVLARDYLPVAAAGLPATVFGS